METKHLYVNAQRKTPSPQPSTPSGRSGLGSSAGLLRRGFGARGDSGSSTSSVASRGSREGEQGDDGKTPEEGFYMDYREIETALASWGTEGMTYVNVDPFGGAGGRKAMEEDEYVEVGEAQRMATGAGHLPRAELMRLYEMGLTYVGGTGAQERHTLSSSLPSSLLGATALGEVPSVIVTPPSPSESILKDSGSAESSTRRVSADESSRASSPVGPVQDDETIDQAGSRPASPSGKPNTVAPEGSNREYCFMMRPVPLLNSSGMTQVLAQEGDGTPFGQGEGTQVPGFQTGRRRTRSEGVDPTGYPPVTPPRPSSVGCANIRTFRDAVSSLHITDTALGWKKEKDTEGSSGTGSRRSPKKFFSGKCVRLLSHFHRKSERWNRATTRENADGWKKAEGSQAGPGGLTVYYPQRLAVSRLLGLWN
ncbi:hypothetical protein EPH_0021070 [Eimeria praecox]|uniref:Uncharacterized protein n=1 Tax=Eimeria praecox TaxID=51316 RepID=U6H2J2_9EIME|nr:hypothetical protein EPH_0021070 [Eimeria praecox]